VYLAVNLLGRDQPPRVEHAAHEPVLPPQLGLVLVPDLGLAEVEPVYQRRELLHELLLAQVRVLAVPVAGSGAAVVNEGDPMNDADRAGRLVRRVLESCR
jgi:hypothetical protein